MASITEWQPIIIAGLGATSAIVGAYFTAKYGGKSGAREAQSDLSAKVSALVPEVAKAREDASAAKSLAAKGSEQADHAFSNAEWAAKELQRHEKEEKERRRDAREAGQKRDDAIAAKVDKIAEQVTTLAAQTDLLLDGRVDTSGGSRRGR
jgi:outer membrane murein-binding lipoprotein Lpp